MVRAAGIMCTVGTVTRVDVGEGGPGVRHNVCCRYSDLGRCG